MLDRSPSEIYALIVCNAADADDVTGVERRHSLTGGAYRTIAFCYEVEGNQRLNGRDRKVKADVERRGRVSERAN
jgi:hypothetical protein